MQQEASGNPFGGKPLAPVWVAVAIVLLPPLGIYLLWKHPVLRHRDRWRRAAYAWTAFWCVAQVGNLFRNDTEAPRLPDAAADAGRQSSSSGTMSKAEFEKEYREMCKMAGEPFNRQLFEEAWQVMRQTGQGY